VYPQQCEKDLERAARIVYTYWSFVVFYPELIDLGRLAEFMPQARAARIPDACADVLDRFMARLDDGHAVLEHYPGRTVRTRPAIVLRSFREQFARDYGELPAVRVFVVDRDSTDASLRPVLPGSELVRVDGLLVDSVYGRRNDRISGSTLWWKDHIADKILLLGPAEWQVELTLRGPDGGVYEVTVPRPPDPFGYDEEKRKRALEEAEETATVAESAILDGGWGYLKVHTFLGKRPGRTADEIDDALDPLLDRPGIVLDLRDNHGGFVDAAVETAGRFVDQKTMIARVQLREPGSEEFAAGFWDEKRGVHAAPPVHAQPRKPIYEGPVVVLVDAGCFSACEILAGGLQSIKRATLVGPSRTGGGSGTVASHRLPSGAVITFSVFVSWRTDGTQIDFEGIVPDVLVSEDPADWVAGRDIVLETAVEILENGKAPTLADALVIKG
jgi:C-terminal processing protease CtpA/Prc